MISAMMSGCYPQLAKAIAVMQKNQEPKIIRLWFKYTCINTTSWWSARTPYLFTVVLLGTQTCIKIKHHRGISAGRKERNLPCLAWILVMHDIHDTAREKEKKRKEKNKLSGNRSWSESLKFSTKHLKIIGS